MTSSSTTTQSNVNAALNILRRTPVECTEENLNAFSMLFNPSNPEAVEDLLQVVDCPLKVASDPNYKHKKYILSDHNRDGNSYRSPWTNTYYPPPPATATATATANTTPNTTTTTSGGFFKPSPKLRVLEQQANEIFESYKQLYYGKDSDNNNSSSSHDTHQTQVVSSVYLWDTTGDHNDDYKKEGFAGCFLIQKKMNEHSSTAAATAAVTASSAEGNNGIRSQKGYWNSIHVTDCGLIMNGKAKYTLSTTILLSIDVTISIAAGDNANTNANTTIRQKEEVKGGCHIVNIGGSLTKQVEKTLPIHTSVDHITNIGKMIEDMEIEMRSNMDALYIQKTKEVIDSLRSSSVMTMSSSGSGSGSGQGRRRGDGSGLMVRGVQAIPPAAQNEMNAALMARFQKKNQS
mmetsp:Transcript_3595/g.4231  ORF Transcript_3595/g.4231 Transcript_3595/m.4231 type:complete len:404 (-) Transcript_3595:65-1276(-)